MAITPAELFDISIFLIERDKTKVQFDSWPKVAPVIEIGSEDIFHVWLLTPAVVSRARQEYLRVAAGDGKVERCLGECIRSFADSLEEFERLDWCVMLFCKGETEAYPSFRSFLEDRVEHSRSDMFSGEERGDLEHICLAYSCR